MNQLLLLAFERDSKTGKGVEKFYNGEKKRRFQVSWHRAARGRLTRSRTSRVIDMTGPG